MLNLRRGVGLMGQVERDQGGFGSEHWVGKDAACRFWIGPDVELGEWGNVADAFVALALCVKIGRAHGDVSEVVANGAAHDAEAGNVGRKRWIDRKEQRRVGERAGGDKPCCPNWG